MRLAPLALAGLLLIGSTGCSGAPEPTSADRGDEEPQSVILQPGEPGEDNETLNPDITLDAAEWNDADAAFMQMMVPHHAQALEMAELAPTRARDEGVAALARRIQGAQGPEIRSMASWLAARGLPVPEAMDTMDHGDHSMSMSMPMAGMLTDEQMAELEAARGARFDRLFLAGMIQHHQGAVEMAGAEIEEGSDQLALELAADISAGQQAEIGRMQDLRRSL